MKRGAYLLFLAAVVCLLASCHHKELCYRHPHTANVRINVDWSEFESYEKPTGMTVKLYPDGGFLDEEARDEMRASGTTATSGGVVTHLTNTISHAVLSLPANSYHVLVFNQSTTEFGSFSFRDMEDKESAVVVMRYRSRWYTSRAGDDDVATDPEWLGVGNFDDARVTQAMVDAEADRSVTGAPAAETPVIAEVTPRNVIYTVNVRIYINNLYNLRSARASMTGMAEGYQLTRGRRLSTEVTHLIERWSLTQDADDPTKGHIDASFTCFGLPGDHAARADENLLTLNVLLVDNKTVETFAFDVGDRFELDESDPNRMTYSVVITDPVTLTDVEPEDGSGAGFDVTVEDWGDEIEQTIPM